MSDSSVTSADREQTAVDRGEPVGPTLQDYLAHREEACPSCRYNLRGLRGSECPECGVALTLRVGLMEPRLFGLITGLMASSLAAGLGWFFFIAIGLDQYTSLIEFFDEDTAAAICLLAKLVLGTLGLVVLVIKRRKLYAMSRPRQMVLAFGSLTLAMGLTVAVLMILLGR